MIEQLTRRELLRRGFFCAGLAASGSLLWACKDNDNDDFAGGNPLAGLNYRVPALRSLTDTNGLLLPEGFSSRVIGQAAMSTGGLLLPLLLFPDGAATFPDPQVPGGWIHVVNSEVPNLIGLTGLPLPGLPLLLTGGVYGFRFAPDGAITSAYPLLTGSDTNCAGGRTPWGTWISCEEVDDGTSYEVHPLGQGMIDGVSYPIRLDSLGIFKHEAAALDPVHKHVYLTEDQGDGRLYRLVAEDTRSWDGSVKIDLSQGRLQVAQVLGDNPAASRAVVWHDLPDPTGAGPTRSQVAQSTPFDGGEGCFYRAGVVYFTTKGDNRVWAYDTNAALLDVIYDDDMFPEPVLSGVDNIIATADGHLVVAEDGGDLQVVVITASRQIAAIAQAPGQTSSEITGLALTPDGTRLYFNSQRWGDIRIPIPEAIGDALGLPLSGDTGGGIIYEVRRDDGKPIFS
ncbi:MAG: alkaline phosphatase PhoX [Nevskiales bacterium]